MKNLVTWIKKQSDMVEAMQNQMDDIDNKLYELRILLRSDFDVIKCQACGAVKDRVMRPVHPDTNVADVNKQIRDLENKWGQLDDSIDNIVAEVESKIEEVFSGTVFDVYGIEVSV